MVEYSNKLKEVFQMAQFHANRYGVNRLESWLLLLAMHQVTDSVAGLVFSEFDEEISPEEFEAAIILLVEKTPKTPDYTKPRFFRRSAALSRLMADAEKILDIVDGDELGTEHLLFAMLINKDLLPFKVLQELGFDKKDEDSQVSLSRLRRALEHQAGFNKEHVQEIYALKRPKRSKVNPMNMMGGPVSTLGEFEDYVRDLTDLARQEQLEPVIGRDKELERVVQILSRKTKNNPVLVGEAGVGKTALAYGLAQQIIRGQVPPALENKRVLELDMLAVVAGTRFRGEFEERMNLIIEEVEAAGDIILFIDEMHTVMGTGAGVESTMDAANILKPALSRGTLHLLGATTQNEYQKHIEKDAALSRRFAKVLIEEPTVEDSLVILKGLKENYENYHRVDISDEALETAVKYAKRYLTSKHLPDSALDLLDETSARIQNKQTGQEDLVLALDMALMEGRFKELRHLLKKQEQSEEGAVASGRVTADDVLETLSQLTGIPLAKMTQADSRKYLRLEEDLHQRVIGQDEAVSAISRAIRRNQSGIRTGKRPIGSFMFLGPTGVGKTELAKALAELLFDDESALIRFDMSEYMEKFAASRLNGAPPGYVGYEEGGELTEKVRQKPYSVLLFDEVEKAHPDVFNVLLQVLDDGQLTDSRGRKADFSNTVIIMTSNLGATALRDDKTVGFGAKAVASDQQAIEKRMMEELKKAYRPEFLNRIDEKVVFHSLTPDHMQDIVKIMVKSLVKQLADKGITLKFQASALKHLAEDGYDVEMGARPLRRTLQTQVEDKLAELLLSGELEVGDTLKIAYTKGKLQFKK